ncbi:MAG: hypothetical protein ACK55Z_04185, partial [bacterium]
MSRSLFVPLLSSPLVVYLALRAQSGNGLLNRTPTVSTRILCVPYEPSQCMSRAPSWPHAPSQT